MEEPREDLGRGPGSDARGGSRTDERRYEKDRGGRRRQPGTCETGEGGARGREGRRCEGGGGARDEEDHHARGHLRAGKLLGRAATGEIYLRAGEGGEGG